MELQRLSTRRKIRGLVAHFTRRRDGAAAVEFAMVSVPFLGLICAIFETAFVFFTHEAFDNWVNVASRQVLTNQSGSGSQSLSSILVCPKNSDGSANNNYVSGSKNAFPGSLAFINCNNIVLNVQAYDPKSTNFSAVASGLGTSWYNQSSSVNLGQPGYIVVFQAFYPMPIYLSVLAATGSNGRRVSNFFGHTSSSVYNNPNGSGFVHAIFSTVVFRNEPS